jgi:hypothetical protein
MKLKVETPPNLAGTPEQQLRMVYSYLFRLSENLNVALSNLNEDSYSSAAQMSSESGSETSGVSSGSSGDAYNELRVLIVNTAEVINSEIDVLQMEMNSKYGAISTEWGAFQENIDTTIEATASEVIQKLNYDSKIETLETEAAGFSEYIVRTEGYIKSGFIEYDDSGVPIIGIAIGQGLTSTKVTVNGEEYDQFDASQSCAFYTAQKVSFRIHGQEVAYVSNSKLYINDVEITGSIVLGGKWLVTTTNGFKIQWIGG